MRKCLLDTSIIIKSLKNDSKVGQILDSLQELYIPLTVVGEFLFGAYKSAQLLKHLAETEKFLSQCIIVFPDRTTAEIYGRTKASLVQKGKPIPENDIWIASTALQYNLSLFAHDKHFREIPGLQLFNPLSSI